MIPLVVSLLLARAEMNADDSVLCWITTAFGPIKDGRSFTASYPTYCEMPVQVSPPTSQKLAMM